MKVGRILHSHMDWEEGLKQIFALCILILEARPGCSVSFQLHAIYGGRAGVNPPAAPYINPPSGAFEEGEMEQSNHDSTRREILDTQAMRKHAILRLFFPILSRLPRRHRQDYGGNREVAALPLCP